MKVLEGRSLRVLRSAIAVVLHCRRGASACLRRISYSWAPPAAAKSAFSLGKAAPAASAHSCPRRMHERLRAGVVARTLSIALVSGAAAALVYVPLTGCAVLHLGSEKPQAPPLQTGPGQIAREQAKQHQPPPSSTLPQPSAENTLPALPPAKQPKIKRAKKRHKAVEAPPEIQQAASNAPPAPIGQLTSGDSKVAATNEHDTNVLIRQTEQGLEGIKRALTPEERNTIVQIRTFLKQAEQALDNGDPDGARMLATKAKLLLDELTSK